MIHTKEVLSTIVYTMPVSQPRRTQRNITTKDGRKVTVDFVPENHPVTAFKAQLALDIGAKMQGPPVEKPVKIGAKFFFPRPKRLLTKSAPTGPIPYTSKPDLDNLIKAVKDAIKNIAWKDDAQVYGYGDLGKFYVEKDGRPRVELTIMADD